MSIKSFSIKKPPDIKGSNILNGVLIYFEGCLGILSSDKWIFYDIGIDEKNWDFSILFKSDFNVIVIKVSILLLVRLSF